MVRLRGADPRTQQWNLEDFKEYFKNERGNLGNSKKFQEVIRAFDQFAGLRGQPVNQETAIKMVKANENLKKACEAYVESRRGARTGSGKERLAVVDCLSMFREDLNLDQARDMRVVRSLEGKTWEQAGRFQVAEVVLEGGDKQVVGDAMSQRLKVEHGGKKGFFTEQMEMESLDGKVDKMIDGVDREKNPALRGALDAIRGNLKDTMRDFMSTTEILDSGFEVMEYFSGMEEKNPMREDLRKVVSSAAGMNMAVKIIREYQSSLKALGPDASSGKKEELMDKAVEQTISSSSYKGYGDSLRACKGAFMDMPPVEEVKNRSARMYRMVKKNFLLARENLDVSSQAGREQREALDRALEDREFMDAWQKGIDIAHASEIGGDTGVIELDVGNELSSRNIASSRVAELLGIGGIVAHSEKMIVRSGDKVTAGCFMEFAEGVDITAKGERSRRVLDQIDATIHPAGFYKDMTSMEVFDYLCAQNDRHGRNMFYKLGEPDGQGRRAIIGLQGIDSDLAFGDKDRQMSETQGLMNEMTFISSDLADKVNALDEDTLRYAIGDLIPENQIQMMMSRVEKFKEHMNKNMVRIEDNEWELNEYSKDQPVDGLDARGKAYVKGLKEMEYTIFSRHKSDVIQNAFNVYRKEREAGPKAAISFQEIKMQGRNAARPEARTPLGKKSEEAVERARLLREEYRKKMEAQKGKQEPLKQGKEKSDREKAPQEAGRKR